LTDSSPADRPKRTRYAPQPDFPPWRRARQPAHADKQAGELKKRRGVEILAGREEWREWRHRHQKNRNHWRDQRIFTSL